MYIVFIFLAMFMLKMYSQDDETGVLEFLENKIWLPNHDGKTFTENFPRGIYISFYNLIYYYLLPTSHIFLFR